MNGSQVVEKSSHLPPSHTFMNVLVIATVFYHEPVKPTLFFINLLSPNVNYSGRTAPLTSKVSFYIFIQQI